MNGVIALDGGRETAAHLHPSADPAGVLLVFAHGAGAGQTHPFLVATAQGLATRGVDVVTFDFPYMHVGRRPPDRPGVLEACFRQVVEWARAHPSLQARALFIGGKSMGGRMATHLGAQGLPGARGIVVLGYPLHPPGIPSRLRTAHLPAVTVPCLVVQGERDAFGTPAELGPVLAAMPKGATLHAVPGADHSLASRLERGPGPPDSVLDVMAGWMRRIVGA